MFYKFRTEMFYNFKAEFVYKFRAEIVFKFKADLFYLAIIKIHAIHHQHNSLKFPKYISTLLSLSCFEWWLGHLCACQSLICIQYSSFKFQEYFIYEFRVERE